MRTRGIVLVLLLVVTAACSTNPATGKREFNIVSEQQEIAMGQEAHQQTIEQFGVYTEKPELTRLVDRIGHDLATVSDRPGLPWHFTILDTPVVNAMALPGGYVYITRGMLERINSEDELAGVLGHEITHVTARHAAQQISRAQVAQLGMVIGAVAAGPAATQQFGQLAELGINLLFQRYSRGQESQADLIGTQYVAKASFNPVGVERMLMTLQRLDKHPASGIDKYFQSHPDPARRVRDVRSKIADLAKANPAIIANEPKREPYIRLTDGMITSNSTQKVVIRGNAVYDRSHGMIVQLPSGWTTDVAPGMLFAMTPRGQSSTAFLAQEIDDKELQTTGAANIDNAVRSRLQQMGLQYLGSRQASTGSGQRFGVDVWSGQTESGPVGVETTQFPHGDHAAVFIFLAPDMQTNRSPLGEILSHTVIDAARARSVEPPRIKVATVRSGESWSDLAKRATGNVRDAEYVANFNGFDVSAQPRSGTIVKLPEAAAPSDE